MAPPAGVDGTRVDFYVLGETDDERAKAGRARTACRLAEKAWQAGYRVFVLSATPGEAQSLDTLLWTFRDDSFVPHRLADDVGAAERTDTPVLLGTAVPAHARPDVLINFTDDVPLSHASFPRIAEIVAGSEVARAAGRERFRFYRANGCEVYSHNL